MIDSANFPEGYSVEAIDWLSSGARSGLVRVRGRRPGGEGGSLPELILEASGETRRFASLPDPRAGRDPTAWRGAYVLDARPVAEADRLWLEWPGSHRIALPALSVPAQQVVRAIEAVPEPQPEGGEVVDRAVLAERRARRAETSEQAQTRIAQEALRAVEVLDLRAGEIEDQLTAVTAERDALRARAPGAPEPDPRVAALQAELAELRAELGRREQAPATVTPIAAGEAERRAQRLRGALTSTIATIAELRQRLHEADVVRRTRDVAAGADAVRLAVSDAERATIVAALEETRALLDSACRERDESVAALQAARSDHELRARFAEQSSELGEARERIGVLEARVAVAEAAIDSAETARELAEAAALAAAAARRAAAVAHAASAERAATAAAPPPEPGAGRVEQPAEPELEPPGAGSEPRAGEDPPTARPVPAELAAAAAEQSRAAAEREPDGDSERLVADLSAAAEALRSSPAIVSARAEPPADLARGRSGREYPPLRGALVKLAHDDPVAAGRLLAGLLKAQHVVLRSPPDYDLTIAEAGTFAVSAAGAMTLVSRLEEPRGRRQAAFHVRTDAVTLAELLAGVDQRARRRRGPLRVTGRVRLARAAAETLEPEVSLAALLAAGAELDPGLALRAFAYAVRPEWTRGQTWTVEVRVDDRALLVSARHDGGLEVSERAGDSQPDARLALSAEELRELAGGRAPAPAGSGDATAIRHLLALADRARGSTID